MRDVLISLGTFLLILGVVLLVLGLVSRVLPKIEELPPILYVQKNFDGVTVGTSPIAIIALIIIYIVLWMAKIVR